MTPEEEEIFGQLPPIVVDDALFQKEEEDEAAPTLLRDALKEALNSQLVQVMVYEILPHIKKNK